MIEHGLFPTPISVTEWKIIIQATYTLFFFVGAGLGSALSFLLAHGVIDSPLVSEPVGQVAPTGTRPLRWVLYGVSAVELGMALWLLWRALDLGVIFLSRFFPRFYI